jgi:PAS domain S-box-containing protein
VDHLPGIVYTFSTKHGGIFWSKPVLPILGYSPEELKADPFIWTRSIHPEDLLQVKHAVDNDALGVDYSIEYRIKTRDGRQVWLHDQFIHKEVNAGETVIHGFAIDITDRKNAEEKLAQKEGELIEAQQIAHIGRWDYWHQEDRLNWSPLIYEFFELEEERFGASYGAFLSAIHPEDREAVDNAWRESLVNQHPYEIDHRLLMGDGRVKWVREYCRTTFDAGGQAIHSTGIVQDITERKEGEQKLAQQKRYLETILETTADGFWVVMPDRTISLANDSYCRMTGYTRAELEKMQINDIDVAENSQETGERIARIMRNGSETFETLHRCKNGRILEVEVSASLLERTDGVFLICFCRDISDRKHAEKYIQKQLSEKEILLKEVHHRVKNNIASIEGLLELQIESAGNAEVIAALKEAITRIHSMRILYEKLLLGKNYCDVSTKEYIESLTKAIVEVYSDNRKVIIENQIMDIPLDSKKLIPVGIIINELMTNVFKYAFKGRESGQVTLSLDASETHLTLTLQDNGIGVDERLVSDRSPGFGLTIVKLLAEQLDGIFTMENENGTKSVLKFEL